MKNYFFSTLCIFVFPIQLCSQYFDLGRQQQYQDIFVNGQVVSQGARMCSSRYEALKKVLDNYKRPITVLDIGASQGYFSFRIAHDYDAVCVMIEGEKGAARQLQDLCRLNTKLDSVIHLKKMITASELERLAECEHFDVVLLFNVAHHVPRWKRFLDAVFQLGDNVIIETPPSSDKHFAGGMGTKVRQVERYLLSKGGTVIARTPRHTDPTAKAKMIWFKRQKKDILRAYWFYPGVRPGCWRVHSDYEKKFFVKKRDGVEQKNEWIPGINMLTFKVLNGVFPDNNHIVSCLSELKEICHGDGFLWNMIIQGDSIHYIDFGDKEGPVPFDQEKVFLYNLGLMHLQTQRQIVNYIKNVDRNQICK